MAQPSSLQTLTKFGFFSMTASLFITVYEYPIFADAGLSLIFFLLVCGLFWFLPVALVSAELASIKGHQDGGIYSWVGTPLGERFGFAAIFFQWFQITVGFVTMLYFIVGTLSNMVNLPIIDNTPSLKFIAVVTLFWLLTFLQFKGTKITEKVAKYGFSIGIVLPILIMFILAIVYFSHGHPISPAFKQSAFIPDNSHAFAALTSFVLAYMGVEASAPHIANLENANKNYPLIMVALVIVGISFSAIGGGVVAMVLPGNISSNAGIIDTFQTLLSSQYSWAVFALGLLISFGVMAQISSWIVSPTEGLRFVATKGLLPPLCQTVNRHQVPVPLLIIQGITVTIWAAILTFGSHGAGGNISFQTAITLTVLIYLSAYVLFFIAYLVVVFTRKEVPRTYQIAGGTIVKVFVALCGLLISLAAIVTAFFIPTTIPLAQSNTYLMLLSGSFIVTLLLPFLFYRFYRKKTAALNSTHSE